MVAAEIAFAAPDRPAVGQQFSDDLPEPLQPVRPRTEAEQDHLDALAHFAAGRVAQQREDYAVALRQMQRAARLDPQSAAALRDIVPLAFALERPGVAVRYALKAIALEPAEPLLMRRLAAYLTEQGDTQQALRLYEKAEVRSKELGEKPGPPTVLTWLEMGRLYYLAEKFDRAAKQFDKVMQALEKPGDYGLDESMKKAIVGSSDVTYQLFGEAFLKDNRLDDAQAAFDKAHAIKADDVQLALNTARIEFLRGNHDQALAKLQEFLKANRGDEGLTPYRLLQEILAAQGKSAELLPMLEQLRADHADSVPLVYFLAEQYRDAEQYPQAIERYRELLKMGEDDRPPIEALRGLVAIYTAGQQIEPLLQVLSEAVGRSGTLELLEAEGQQLLANKERVAQLLAEGEKIWEQKPDDLNFGGRLTMARLALAEKKFDDANRWFDRAWQVKPADDPEFALVWGLDLLLAEQYPAAVDVLKRVIDEKLLPADNPAAHYYLAGALEMAGRTDEAIAAARACAAMRADSARFAARVPWILYHAKRHEEAASEYRQLLERFDAKHDSDEVRDVMRDARLVLSSMAVERGDMPAAEEYLEQVLDEFPDDVGAHNDLGYLYADQNKRPNRALRMTQYAVSKSPDNAAYRDSAAWALYRLGRYEEAAAELGQALALEEAADGVMFEHLGDVMVKLNDTEAARKAYQQAVAEFEKQSDQKKLEQLQQKLQALPPAN
jgi:tetratricopeptide (TPR) repeat protein